MPPQDPPMNLEEQGEAPETELTIDDDVQQTEPTPAKDDDGVPYCRIHHCRMKQYSGKKKGAPPYYKCPVRSCEATAKSIKTTVPGVVPPQPLECARCSAPKKPVYCERDSDSSTAACVILKCPSCGWKSNAMAVPQLAAAHFASRQQGNMPPADIGDR